MSMILVFFTTSLTFKFLGTEDYGAWATIYSIISWVYFLDFGFSNVIKTKLPVIIQDKISKVNVLISTVYIGLGIVSLIIISIFILLNCFMSMSEFLNINATILNFNLILFLNLLFAVLVLVIGNYKSLFAGIIKTQVVEFSMMIIQLTVFCFVFVISEFNLFQDYSKILVITLVFGLANILISIGFTKYFFYTNKKLKISLKYFDLNVLKENSLLGLKYFIIQICMIIIYSTDYILIAKYFGIKEVTNYDIVLKLFQIPMLLAIAGLSPFWAIFSKNFAEKKFHWIKKTLIRFNFLFIFFIAGVVVLTLIIHDIIFLWLKVHFEISKILLISISFYITMRSFTAMYNYFLNGINKINLTLYLTIFGAIINIPICIFLIKTGMGIPGIVIGTCISILPTTVVLPIQSFIILNNKIRFFK